ncbi:unnamed protein product [Dimorphilus gyrociliatus]|uniref:Cadherin domain-containing protein n=1 Tax=Dimorphilus gyrociliatus TaxID=2664684 RepID=A0A7I8VTP9_9ANNE|nr:unnamed protein product [Dimorphilus gyrociliatus]
MLAGIFLFFLRICLGFGKYSINFSILDQTPPKTVVGYVLKSKESKADFRLFETSEMDFSKNFSLGKFGELKTETTIDRDYICTNKETCLIKLEGGMVRGRSFQLLPITVQIRDINDNNPKFPFKSLRKYISESARPEHYISIPKAYDPDKPEFSIKSYKLNVQPIFSLRVTSNDLRLVLRTTLDREKVSKYNLKLTAIDGGRPRKTGSMRIHIIVEDSNDNEPVFDKKFRKVVVYEDFPHRKVLAKVRATDKDKGENARITYKFTPRTELNFGDIFSLDPISGEIRTKVSLDYESNPNYELSILAIDNGNSPKSAETQLQIRVIDLNDNPPMIHVIKVDVAENSEKGTFAAQITVRDADKGENGRISCQMNSSTFHLYVINKNRYQINTWKPLDREIRDTYSLIIECKDFGKNVQISKREIIIKVLDINDNPPSWKKQIKTTLKIPENLAIGEKIADFSAFDPDLKENGTVRYSVEQLNYKHIPLVEIESSTGILRSANEMDREKIDMIQMKITARDLGKIPLKASLNVTLKIEDEDDNDPKFSKQFYNFYVYENEPIGKFVGLIECTDADVSFKEANFKLDKSLDYKSFTIDRKGSIRTKKVFDRERRKDYNIKVVVAKSSVYVQVSILDKNDNPPIFIGPKRMHLSRYTRIGTAVKKLKVIDADAGKNGVLIYSILDDNRFFWVHTETGVITVIGDLTEASNQVIELNINISDCGEEKQSLKINFQIFLNETQTLKRSNLDAPNIEFLISAAFIFLILFVFLLVFSVIIIRKRFKLRRGSSNSAKFPAQSSQVRETSL